MHTILKSAVRHNFLWWCCALFAMASASNIQAENLTSKIMSRPEMSQERRQELAVKLRAITGWPELHFDAQGALSFGQAQPAGGSSTARAFLSEAVRGQNLIVLEDASNRADVVFCRVVEGRWKHVDAGKPPVHIVLIDFSDFSHLMGDAPALSAFNVGWGVMHEIDHVVHDSSDPTHIGDAGACESLINQMRRECGLAERSDYYFTSLPGSERNSFKSKFVRLAFVARQPSQRLKKYWLLWDAEQVGGIPADHQLALAQ